LKKEDLYARTGANAGANADSISRAKANLRLALILRWTYSRARQRDDPTAILGSKILPSNTCTSPFVKELRKPENSTTS